MFSTKLNQALIWALNYKSSFSSIPNIHEKRSDISIFPPRRDFLSELPLARLPLTLLQIIKIIKHQT